MPAPLSRLNLALWPVAFLIVSAWLVGGCRGAIPVAAPASVPIPAATAANVPPPTPVPTVQASPTAVPPPSPTPTALVVEQVTEPSGSVAKRYELAPDFELTLFNGDTVRMSDLEGKVVVLNFWASWCPPCRWEMPDFEEMWIEYKDKDVVFVGVAISDFEQDARAFADETGVTYPIGLDRTGVIARAYRPTSMPTTFFIDRDGVVARKLASVANTAVLRLFIDGQLKDG